MENGSSPARLETREDIMRACDLLLDMRAMVRNARNREQSLQIAFDFIESTEPFLQSVKTYLETEAAVAVAADVGRFLDAIQKLKRFKVKL